MPKAVWMDSAYLLDALALMKQTAMPLVAEAAATAQIPEAAVQDVDSIEAPKSPEAEAYSGQPTEHAVLPMVILYHWKTNKTNIYKLEKIHRLSV